MELSVSSTVITEHQLLLFAKKPGVGGQQVTHIITEVIGFYDSTNIVGWSVKVV